jgi:3-hydroxyisobutyrate dehydrogenase-like beta-hydroxyacid dehydrogenase
MTVNSAGAEAAPGQQTSVGFVGLGNMGAVMSARLVAAGFTVHGHDISPSARAALADAGGLAPDNLATPCATRPS